MKQWAHLIASIALATIALVMHFTTQNSDIVRPLDRARFYTLIRETGDVGGAANLLRKDNWLTEDCQLQTNLTDSCVLLRSNLRDKILEHMKCNLYSSQACSYLRLALKSLAQNMTDRLYAPNGTFTTRTIAVGKKMSGKAPNGEMYNEILRRIVETAPVLFHAGARAEQSDSTYMLHSVLFALITLAILGNLLVHIIDTFPLSGPWKALARMTGFALTLLFSIIFLASNAGIYAFLLLILLPSLLILVYFEYLLDPTLERPWSVFFFLFSRPSQLFSFRRFSWFSRPIRVKFSANPFNFAGSTRPRSRSSTRARPSCPSRRTACWTSPPTSSRC
jgi:hypothetical protein